MNFVRKNMYVLEEFVQVTAHHTGRVMRKPDFGLCENKAADQLRGNCEADQCLCFRYMDSTIPNSSTFKI